MTTELPNSVLIARRQFHRAIKKIPPLGNLDTETAGAAAKRAQILADIWTVSANYAQAVRAYVQRVHGSTDVTKLPVIGYEALLADLTTALAGSLDHDHLSEPYGISKKLEVWIPAELKEKHRKADTDFRILDAKRVKKTPAWINAILKIVLQDDNSRNVILSAKRGELLSSRVHMAQECAIAAWVAAWEYVESYSGSMLGTAPTDDLLPVKASA